jgi:hypothetical protein
MHEETNSDKLFQSVMLCPSVESASTSPATCVVLKKARTADSVSHRSWGIAIVRQHTDFAQPADSTQHMKTWLGNAIFPQ